mgnify:CR=1 FL=1
MSETVSRSLFWPPRILGILFSLFLVVFSFDVFRPGLPAREVALAFLVHNIPTALMLLVIALAWRHDLLGAVVFTGLGFLYVVATWGRFPWTVYVAIGGPLFLVGGLFFASWLAKRHLPHGPAPAPQH